jgi:hypothetical protein
MDKATEPNVNNNLDTIIILSCRVYSVPGVVWVWLCNREWIVPTDHKVHQMGQLQSLQELSCSLSEHIFSWI